MHLTLAWREGGAQRIHELFVRSREATPFYFDGPPWRYFASCDDAALFEFEARSRVLFMDNSDLRRSSGVGPLRDVAHLAGVRSLRRLRGFERAALFFLPGGSRGVPPLYLITAEPRGDEIDSIVKLCCDASLPLAVGRPGIGVADVSARLVLIEPPGRGMPPDVVAPMIERVLPDFRKFKSEVKHELRNTTTG